jgi:prohibitin 2
VEGGQRAIIFNRIGGIQKDTVLAEGLHFRYDRWSIEVTPI